MLAGPKAEYDDGGQAGAKVLRPWWPGGRAGEEGQRGEGRGKEKDAYPRPHLHGPPDTLTGVHHLPTVGSSQASQVGTRQAELSQWYKRPKYVSYTPESWEVQGQAAGNLRSWRGLLPQFSFFFF